MALKFTTNAKTTSKTLGLCALLPLKTSQSGLCNLQSTHDDVGRIQCRCVGYCCFALFRGKQGDFLTSCSVSSHQGVTSMSIPNVILWPQHLFFWTFLFWKATQFLWTEGPQFHGYTYAHTHTHAQTGWNVHDFSPQGCFFCTAAQ